jgi:hypothetical protein
MNSNNLPKDWRVLTLIIVVLLIALYFKQQINPTSPNQPDVSNPIPTVASNPTSPDTNPAVPTPERSFGTDCACQRSDVV